MSQLLDHLNPAQREAAAHIDGPLLILAGPGSGKTRVVTHRVANLLAHGAHASQILALTFTNKAASEMQRRVYSLAPGHRVWVSTFHRFGARILREFHSLVGLQPNYTIYDTSDAKQTLKRVLEAEQIDTAHYTPDKIAAAISKAKNALISHDQFEPKSSSPLSAVVAQAYPAYQQRLLASSAVDFDDLLLHVARLLHDSPEVRAELDARFRYILVDEYQDTNRAQYVMLRAMSHDYPNLAATGDPDQSIYGWRGADLNNILEFESDYPQVKIVRLEQNYRSTGGILRVADALIANNQRRKKKSLFTEKPLGNPVRLVTYSDGDEEARDIAEQIAGAIERGERRPSDFAIFYRINALSRSIERALRAAQVPFQMVRGQEFFQRKEIRDVLAYCQLLNNPLDDVAVSRTINSPPRGIGKKTLERLNAHAYRYKIPLLDAATEAGMIDGLTTRPVKALRGYVETIQRLATYAGESIEALLGAVLTETGYRDQLDKDDEEDANRLANLEELLTDARQFDDTYDGDNPLEEYLERTWLVNETDGWEEDTDKVTLMTLHAAKGLEFPAVYLMAVEDGILPHERSLDDPMQVEEERRLAFVGITRAEEQLQISHALRRDFRGQRQFAVPSSFLMEMPRDEMDTQRASNHTSYDVIDWEVDQEHPEEAWQVEGNAGATEGEWSIPAAAVTTAAAMVESERSAVPKSKAKTDPEAFKHGMTVLHPEHGLGKIITLSGAGNKRKATVRFATAGEKSFVLAFSPLQPAGAAN